MPIRPTHLLAALAFFGAGCGGQAPVTSSVPAPATLAEAPIPTPPPVAAWPRPAHSDALIQETGLPMMRFHSAKPYFHMHAHLDVFMDRQPVEVPAEIGISPVTKKMAAIHTHSTSGIIHIESESARDFTLGQFFKLWNVPLTGAAVYVNGEPAGAPESLVLADHQQIVVSFGLPPVVVPREYTFWDRH